MSWGYQEWRPYVSVAAKLNKGRKHAAAVAKKQKRQPQPVAIGGRKIATTFWGKAWCDNLQAYQDFANRLPRGVTYVRNGSVVDLVIKAGRIDAIVAGSDPYEVQIEIRPLDVRRWKSVKADCSASIDSLLDLLSGKLSDGVMTRLTDKDVGLFPAPAEIKLRCSCPDYSSCCKHIAAVMYGVGARFDKQPELLFLLRGVDHSELASQAIAAGNLDRELTGSGSQLADQDLSALFGIELDSTNGTGRPAKAPSRRASAKAADKFARTKNVAGSKAPNAKPASVKQAAKKPNRSGPESSAVASPKRTPAKTGPQKTRSKLVASTPEPVQRTTGKSRPSSRAATQPQTVKSSTAAARVRQVVTKPTKAAPMESVKVGSKRKSAAVPTLDVDAPQAAPLSSSALEILKAMQTQRERTAARRAQRKPK